MPYQLQGKCVQVKRSGTWSNLKCHPSRAKALSHLAALKANVHKDDHGGAETFDEVGSEDAIRTEIWRLDDRLFTSIRSILFDAGEDDDRKALLDQTLEEFSTEIRSRFPKWLVGEAVEKRAPGARHRLREITKIDEDQNLVFGWFNVVTKVDGEPLLDLQNDMIAPEVLEKAAYEFVLDSREGGVMHKGDTNATLVESMVFTREKVEAMEKQSEGTVKIDVPDGWWWGGFKIHDDDVFALVKDGTLAMFSFEGTAVRVEVEDVAA